MAVRHGFNSAMKLSKNARLLSTARSDKRPEKFCIHDVTARDGIQNEKTILNLDEKVDLVKHVVESNPSSVEVCSFVRGDLVPAMAGAEDLCKKLGEQEWATLARKRGMGFAGLVPNMRGFETFRRASGIEGSNKNDPIIDTAVCLVSCTESHSQANVRMSLTKAMDTTGKVVRQAKDDGFKVRAYASLAFHCPFEGFVDPKVVLDIVHNYIECGADIVILADTLGKALPDQVTSSLQTLLEVLPVDKIGLHMHDAHGRAQENLFAAAELGIFNFDSSTGGAGGCNFVPNAKGNISTQSVVALAQAMEIPHGMDTKALDRTGLFLQQTLQRPLDNAYKLQIHA